MKKLLGILLCTTITATCVVGCSSNKALYDSEFDESNEIVVVSREDGSGTRGAFIELVGVKQNDVNGNAVDMTTDEAIVSNSTAAVMTTVSENKYAIGYISLGAVNDTVKTVTVDGVEVSADNIDNGTYKLARPFNIVTASEIDEVSQDFIDFIMSADGQIIISDNDYIEIENSGDFMGKNVSGDIVIAGSSSVTPVMEKLKEAYEAINKNVNIEIQESDSTTGITSVAEGTCQIGMASRELKDEEEGMGLVATAIAMDGIAVIVNKNNSMDDLSISQIRDIFCGEIIVWDDIK